MKPSLILARTHLAAKSSSKRRLRLSEVNGEDLRLKRQAAECLVETVRVQNPISSALTVYVAFLWTEVECSLSGQERGSYFDEGSKTWRITDHVLDEIENDLRLIINCTRPNDVVLFDVASAVTPASPVFIPWSLVLGTRGGEADVEGNATVATNVVRKTVLRCPEENEGLFVVR